MLRGFLLNWLPAYLLVAVQRPKREKRKFARFCPAFWLLATTIKSVKMPIRRTTCTVGCNDLKNTKNFDTPRHPFTKDGDKGDKVFYINTGTLPYLSR